MRRIFRDYEGYENQPEYSVSDNGVIVTLYNRNYKNVSNNAGKKEAKRTSTQDRKNNILSLMIDDSNTNHHLYCQDCYFSKLFVFKIINNLAVIKLRGFLIGFQYYMFRKISANILYFQF